MKILLLIDNLHSGGAQRQIVNLAIGLKQLGHDPILLTYTEGDHFQKEVEQAGVTLKSLNTNGALWRRALTVLGFIRKQKPDIICAYLMTPSLLALLAKILFRVPKVFVSERVYETFIIDWSKPFCRFLYPFADGIISNSESQALFLRKKFPRLVKRILYIPNCVNLENFAPAQTSSMNNNFWILGAGRIIDYKNILTLIAATEILCKEWRMPISVSWVGRQYEEVGKKNEYFDQCEDEIGKRGINENWVWEGKRSDLNNLYQRADLFVHPSYGEGFPNVISEALASGCPVIASNSLDHPLIIKDNYNGYLFSPTDPEDLALKIKQYFTLTYDRKQEIKRNARLTAVNSFSIKKMIDSYLNLFMHGSIS